jgi:hypothetical protein
LFDYAEPQGGRRSQSRKSANTKEITNEYSGLPRRFAPRNDVDNKVDRNYKHMNIIKEIEMDQVNRKVTPKVLSFDTPALRFACTGVKTAKDIQNTVGVSLKMGREQHWLGNGFGTKMNKGNSLRSLRGTGRCFTPHCASLVRGYRRKTPTVLVLSGAPDTVETERAPLSKTNSNRRGAPACAPDTVETRGHVPLSVINDLKKNQSNRNRIEPNKQ